MHRHSCDRFCLPSSNLDSVGLDSLIIGWHVLFGKMTEFDYFGGSFVQA